MPLLEFEPLGRGGADERDNSLPPPISTTTSLMTDPVLIEMILPLIWFLALSI